MKIKGTSGIPFEKIGTVIAYQDRKFYPSNMEGMTEGEIQELLESSLKGELFYPSSVISDLTDISLYDFRFDLLEDKKYTPEFLPSLLDDFSLTTLGIDLDSSCSLMCPQVSSETEHKTPRYFGGVQDRQGNQIRLLELDQIIEGGNYSGIWKLEVYNEKIKGNVRNRDKEFSILDYDVFSQLEESGISIPYTLEYKPSIRIYFGPTYKTRLLGQSYEEAIKDSIYSERYLRSITQEEYNNFPIEISETDYIKAYKNEVLSRKLIALVYNGDGNFDAVNITETSFDVSKNPGRNQHLRSSRMDDYLDYDLNVLKPKDNFVFDKSSGTLLGTKLIDKFPILESRKRVAPPSLRTPKVRKLKIDGISWVKGNTTKIWDDPVISPDWNLDREIKSNFTECYISTSTGGILNPIGLYSVNGSIRSLEISQDSIVGYKLDNISIRYYGGNLGKGEITRKINVPEPKYTFGGETDRDQEGNIRPIPTYVRFNYITIPYTLDIRLINEDTGRELLCSQNPEELFVEYLTENETWETVVWGELTLDYASELTFRINWVDCKYDGEKLIGSTSHQKIYPSMVEGNNSVYTVDLKKLGTEEYSGYFKSIINIPVKIKELTVFVTSLSENIQVRENYLILGYGDEGIIEFTSSIACQISVDPEVYNPDEYAIEEQIASILIRFPRVTRNHNIILYYENQ